MPPEFCEYGPDFESHCDPWLKKNKPDLHSKLKSLRSGAKKETNEDGDEPEVEENLPTAPWTIEERLTAFYEKYQPEKVSDVPSLLEKYAGNEEKLFVALVKKYGSEPEDPYCDSDDEDDDDDDDELEEGMENLNVAGGKKRRGVRAKTAEVVETRVVIQKLTRNKRKATTVVVGLDTMPGLKLKDASKAFSKKFAGSSSVKDGLKGKEIIIQGNHMEDVADMIVSKFKVPGTSVFLDMDGEFVAYA
jgi:density-regulated protein DRP1